MRALPAPQILLDGAVELRETHISWVFLAGPRAYKVKKPLVLPFLDYGTAARRRAMCRVEVELNRRLAPDVYLGVRGLVPAGDGLRLTDEDDPAAVDYAVEMRRHADDATLAAALARGAAGLDELTEVGKRLAAFHAAADVHPGGAEPVKRALDDNFASLQALSRDRAPLVAAERSATAFLAGVWDELDARAAAGRVRDGHGDLRMEHVLLGPGGIEVVDCVEFNDGLRRIDVGADLTFLTMELHEAGRPDLAAALVTSYRAAGGDPGSDVLLAFFAAYRAEVRAKVALLRAEQAPVDDARERGHADALLALGRRMRWAARTPLVIVLAGVSASGKSTIAAALAAESGFAHVNSDVVRKRHAGLAATERAPLRLYDDDVSRATYAELGRLAAASAATGVIVDATFRRRADRDAFRNALGAAAEVVYVECHAPAAVLEARALARLADRDRVSDADVAQARRQRAEAEPLDEIAADDHVIVRTDRAVPAIVAEVADALDRRQSRARSSPLPNPHFGRCCEGEPLSILGA